MKNAREEEREKLESSSTDSNILSHIKNDLTLRKAWQQVQAMELPALGRSVLIGTRSREEGEEAGEERRIFVPTLASEKWSMARFAELFAALEGVVEAQCITLAIVAPDSAILYYEVHRSPSVTPRQ
ncbi:uncharacterized protein VTP21DRAFT_94 [Calcarisporiella thermophila]|uniref:uncharacterized protein n=1 Tax=Calcarisporiella thermophila TaxID=911321 RepID=UPI003743D9B8